MLRFPMFARRNLLSPLNLRALSVLCVKKQPWAAAQSPPSTSSNCPVRSILLCAPQRTPRLCVILFLFCCPKTSHYQLSTTHSHPHSFAFPKMVCLSFQSLPNSFALCGGLGVQHVSKRSSPRPSTSPSNAHHARPMFSSTHYSLLTTHFSSHRLQSALLNQNHALEVRHV